MEESNNVFRMIHRYGHISGSACFMFCISVAYQDGYISSSFGAGVGLGVSATAGGVSARPYEQSPKGWMGCFGDGPGACYIGGVKSGEGDQYGHAETYHGGSVGVGVTLWVGVTYNWGGWRIGTRDGWFFPDL